MRSSGISLFSISLEFGSQPHAIPRQPRSLRFLCELGVVAYAFHPCAREEGAGQFGELEAFLVYIVCPMARPPGLHSVTLSQEKVKNKVIL